MEPTPKQISVLKQDFAASVSAPHGVRTGPTFDKFYCPILNEDSFGARGLMEGHILPVKLKSGSRATVVQRTDVDNYFGETIEPHLIDWVNLPRVTLKELLGKVSDLRATGLDGSESELFFANPQSKPPHPQIVLRDQKEGILGSPFLKTDVQNVPYRSHIKVVGTLGTSMPAIVGAFVKSAHLAMFRLTGYDWVFTNAGQYTAKVLADFFRQRGTAQTAGGLFAPFRNALHFLEGDFPDTLGDGKIIWHWDERCRFVWGSSTLFRINGYTFMVTLPRDVGADFEIALNTYAACAAANWKYPQRMRWVHVDRKNDKIVHCVQGEPLFSFPTREEYLAARG